MSVFGGAARRYELDIDSSRLFVESGYAFALNIHPTLCPSGPYCWQHDRVIRGLATMGLPSTMLYVHCGDTQPSQTDLQQIQLAVQDSLVYVMAMEFQLVEGISDNTFRFTLPWGPGVEVCLTELVFDDFLAQTNPNIFGWAKIEQTAPATSSNIRAGLSTALMMYNHPNEFPFKNYIFGLSAYETWWTALDSGNFNAHGHWWNCMVWSECRGQIAKYFGETVASSHATTKSLHDTCSKISQLLEKSADAQASNEQKATWIRAAYELDKTVPPLIQEFLDLNQ